MPRKGQAFWGYVEVNASKSRQDKQMKNQSRKERISSCGLRIFARVSYPPDA